MYDKEYIIFYNKDVTKDEAFEHKNVLANEIGEVFGRYQHISYESYIEREAIYVISVTTKELNNYGNMIGPIYEVKRYMKDDTRIINYCKKGDLKKELLGITEAVTMFMRDVEEEEQHEEIIQQVKYAKPSRFNASYALIIMMITFTCFSTFNQHMISAILYMMLVVREVNAISTYEVDYGN